MLTTRLIPCLDVRDGRVVKGVRFAGLRDAGDPAELAARYEQEGADELVVLDVAATPQKRGTQLETVRQVRAMLSIPLTVGGGVRDMDSAAALLDAGADKVAVNSAAVRRPDLLDELSERFGAQCTVLAIDAARAQQTDSHPLRWNVLIESGATSAQRDAVDWAVEAGSRGAGEILLTSWDRDGTGEGYDLDLIAAVRSAVSMPIIASGGAAGPEHLVEAVRAGADAVLAASIFHDRAWSVRDVKHAMHNENLEVRL